MKRLVFVLVLVLAGCQNKALDEKLNQQTLAINAIVNYIATAQEKGDLPKPSELDAWLKAQKEKK